MVKKMSENSQQKILLVEDEPNIAMLFKYNLTKAGYLCETANNGKVGFEKVAEFQPDLIISDIMMPEVDGFEFRKMLLADSELAKIPFIFLTAKGSEEDILNGYDMDIEEYIIKTSSPRIVLAKIAAVLKVKAKEREKAVEEVHQAADLVVALVGVAIIEVEIELGKERPDVRNGVAQLGAGFGKTSMLGAGMDLFAMGVVVVRGMGARQHGQRQE